MMVAQVIYFLIVFVTCQLVLCDDLLVNVNSKKKQMHLFQKLKDLFIHNTIYY